MGRPKNIPVNTVTKPLYTHSKKHRAYEEDSRKVALGVALTASAWPLKWALSRFLDFSPKLAGLLVLPVALAGIVIVFLTAHAIIQRSSQNEE